jgi:hypothetical protein
MSRPAERLLLLTRPAIVIHVAAELPSSGNVPVSPRGHHQTTSRARTTLHARIGAFVSTAKVGRAAELLLSLPPCK